MISSKKIKKRKEKKMQHSNGLFAVVIIKVNLNLLINDNSISELVRVYLLCVIHSTNAYPAKGN